MNRKDQSEFESIHLKGSKRFKWDWIKVNQWIIDVAVNENFDIEKHRLMFSKIAYKILVNIK